MNPRFICSYRNFCKPYADSLVCWNRFSFFWRLYTLEIHTCSSQNIRYAINTDEWKRVFGSILRESYAFEYNNWTALYVLFLCLYLLMFFDSNVFIVADLLCGYATNIPWRVVQIVNLRFSLAFLAHRTRSTFL